MNSREETIALSWSMDDESWGHWAQGLGKQTISDVVLGGLREIRKNPKEAKKIKLRCDSINMEKQDPSGTDTKKTNRIEIQLPSAHWTEACQRVGYLGDNPVRPAHLLAAIILESRSWKQHGNDEAEFDAGANLDSLISSVDLSAELTHTKAISLGKQEKIMALIVTAATVVSALAASAAALAAFQALKFLAPQ